MPAVLSRCCAVTCTLSSKNMRLLILAVFALPCMACCEEGAKLLASKSLLNRYAVEDWTLRYITCTACSSFVSAPGQGGILAQREFDRRVSPCFLDWAAFGMMTLPSIGTLLPWDLSERKCNTPKTKKK